MNKYKLFYIKPSWKLKTVIIIKQVTFSGTIKKGNKLIAVTMKISKQKNHSSFVTLVFFSIPRKWQCEVDGDIDIKRNHVLYHSQFSTYQMIHLEISVEIVIRVFFEIVFYG